MENRDLMKALAVDHTMENQELHKKIIEDVGAWTQLIIKEKKSNDELHKSCQNQLKRENEELHKNIAQLKKNLKVKDEKIEALTILLAEEKKSKDLLEESRIMFKRQREKLHQKIIQVAEKTDAMLALELEIEKLRGNLYELQDECRKLNAMKGSSLQLSFLEKQVKTMQAKLIEKEDEHDHLEDLNQALIITERMSNNELHEARKEMIYGWKKTPKGGSIGVKRMGELNEEPFLRVLKKRYSVGPGGYYPGTAERKAECACIIWDAYLRDPRWHPFKVITVNEEHQKILDPEDERLKALQKEYGNEVYTTVVSALNEMKDYNPSGKFFGLELWNYDEGRKATLKEGVSYLLNMDKQ